MPRREDENHDHSEVEDPSIIYEKIINPSTIETIDQALYNWIDEELNLKVLKNKGWKKVPVIWTGAERSFNVKHNRDLRNDRDGSFNLPLISIERTGFNKDLTKRFFGNVLAMNDEQGGSIVMSRRINQEKTRNFARADAQRRKGQLNFPRKNKKVVYQTISTPAPVYVEVTYGVTIRTEYQQHMNDLIVPFATVPEPRGINSVFITEDQHHYEAFIDGDFSFDNNISNLSEEERKFQTKINMRVMGYLIGEDKNQVKPRVVIRENAVEVRIPRERVIVGDINENLDEGAFYRD
tara:strand:+ start:126 stop:1007 length:882 start_codon:yes stop_codon:yes gene_type:complete